MLPALFLMKSAATIPNARLSYTTYISHSILICVTVEKKLHKKKKSLVFKSYSNETRFFPKTTLAALSEY